MKSFKGSQDKPNTSHHVCFTNRLRNWFIKITKDNLMGPFILSLGEPFLEVFKNKFEMSKKYHQSVNKKITKCQLNKCQSVKILVRWSFGENDICANIVLNKVSSTTKYVYLSLNDQINNFDWYFQNYWFNEEIKCFC